MAGIDDLEQFLGEPRTYADIKKWAEDSHAEDPMELCMEIQKQGRAIRVQREGAPAVFCRPGVKVSGAKPPPPAPRPGRADLERTITPKTPKQDLAERRRIKKAKEAAPPAPPEEEEELEPEPELEEEQQEEEDDAGEEEQIAELTRPAPAPARNMPKPTPAPPARPTDPFAAAAAGLEQASAAVDAVLKTTKEKIMPPQESDTLTSAEAAELLGVGTSRVLTLWHDKKIKGKKSGDGARAPILFDRASVEAFAAVRAGGEVPPSRALAVRRPVVEQLDTSVLGRGVRAGAGLRIRFAQLEVELEGDSETIRGALGDLVDRFTTTSGEG